MLRIKFGLTWPLDLVERLHGMADFDSRHIASTPPVWIRIVFFLIQAFTQNNPPNPVTQRQMCIVHVTQVNMNVNIPHPPNPVT